MDHIPPGIDVNEGLADQLAEVGVILLMFGVGLQFHYKELLAVKRIAVPDAVFQSLVATALGAGVMHLLGWSWLAGIIFGLAISVASTVVLMRVLVDHNELHTPTATSQSAGWWWRIFLRCSCWWFCLLYLATAPKRLGGLWLALGVATLKIVALIAFTFLVGGWVIPRLLGYIAKTGSRELFTLGALVVALGITVRLGDAVRRVHGAWCVSGGYGGWDALSLVFSRCHKSVSSHSSSRPWAGS